MDDRFRTSDADRDRVAALLRDHFAAGRLTLEELDERLTAALNGKTFGDLRHALADLPEPGLALMQADLLPPQVAPLWIASCCGPRMLRLAVLALVVTLLIPAAGWFFRAVLLLWLAASVTGISWLPVHQAGHGLPGARADQRADDGVAWVMHSGVHPGVRDGRGQEPAQVDRPI